MIPVEGLHHTGLFVRRLDRSVRFYEQVLGMETFLRVERQAFLRFGRGDELALFEDAQKAPQDGARALRDPHHKAHVCFRVSEQGYASARQALEEAGLEWNAVAWGDHECLYFLDPDGNLLELNGPRRS